MVIERRSMEDDSSDNYQDVGCETEDPVFDLNNFPDPGKYLCLKSEGITTEEQFKDFWKKLCGQEIIKFESFTVPTQEEKTQSDVNLLIQNMATLTVSPSSSPSKFEFKIDFI